jgi:hypothetical protein
VRLYKFNLRNAHEVSRSVQIQQTNLRHGHVAFPSAAPRINNEQFTTHVSVT